MNLLKSLFAVVPGIRYCALEPSVRRLALWPWGIGAVTYMAATYGAFQLHPSMLEMLTPDGSGWVATLLRPFAWLLGWMMLIAATLLITVIAVSILAGPFQTAIATRVLKLLNRHVPEETGLVREAGRTIRVETVKLLWLAPLFVVAFCIGFIPLLLPVAAVMGGWLLGYQCVDVVLDIYRWPVRKRFSFGRENGWMLVCLGLGLGMLGAIPLAGFLVPPIGAAAAAWLLATTRSIPESTPG